MCSQHCGYWCLVAKAPGHQYPQCWPNIRCIGPVSYRILHMWWTASEGEITSHTAPENLYTASLPYGWDSNTVLHQIIRSDAQLVSDENLRNRYETFRHWNIDRVVIKHEYIAKYHCLFKKQKVFFPRHYIYSTYTGGWTMNRGSVYNQYHMLRYSYSCFSYFFEIPRVFNTIEDYSNTYQQLFIRSLLI